MEAPAPTLASGSRLAGRRKTWQKALTRLVGDSGLQQHSVFITRFKVAESAPQVAKMGGSMPEIRGQQDLNHWARR
jgi:hypothetical protein